MLMKMLAPENDGNKEGSEEDSDDEVVMPEGPPPEKDEEEGSDDSGDIPLPDGPPPPKAVPPPSVGPSMLSAPPVPLPVRPSFASPMMPPIGMSPFPPGTSFPSSPFQPQHRPPPPHTRPPNIQDPLSDAPTQTYQGFRMMKHDLPPRPTPSSTGGTEAPSKQASPAAQAGSGTISAAPQLRDLRKEATAFVPRGVKRKKPPAGGVAINAAPGAGELDADGDEVRTKRAVGGGLMGKLSGVLGEMKRDEKGGAGDDDYQRFLEGLGDLV